ncbi:MAG: right-handed parallel beta-helix repeat-containing protein [Flavitalea sp.]
MPDEAPRNDNNTPAKLASAKENSYYFALSGNDKNNGKINTPKKSLEAAVGLMTSGNHIFFNRGDSWYAEGSSLDLRNRSDFTIDAYGKGRKPVIASLKLLNDSQWKNVSGSPLWKYEVSGYVDALRLFQDGASGYKVNATDSSATEKNADELLEWYIKRNEQGDGATIFLNTGQVSARPHKVEVLPARLNRPTVFMKYTQRVRIRNIDFRGGGRNEVVMIEAPASDIIIDSCIIQEAMGSGIVVTKDTSDKSLYPSNITITNNLVDKVWSAHENDPALRSLTGDGIFIVHAADTGIIRGNTVRNWGHTGITLTSYLAGYHGVHHFIIEQNDVSSGASGYMHALDINGFEGLTTNNIIRRNYFHDYSATIHAQGDHNKYYSNIFAGITLTTMPRQHQQPYGMDLMPWRYRDGNWMAAHDNYIVNNTIVDCEQYPIALSEDPLSTNVMTNNIIANNVICGFGKSRLGTIGLSVSPDIRGSIFVAHNNFWNNDNSAPVARFRNKDVSLNYTAAQLNNAFPDFCSGNIQEDPRFADRPRRDFHLTSQSPETLRTGGTNRYMKEMGNGFVDYFGRPWNKEKPSIGAIQYQ